MFDVRQQDDGSWIAGYFVAGELEDITDPKGVALRTAENVDRRMALVQLAQSIDLAKEWEEQKKRGR